MVDQNWLLGWSGSSGKNEHRFPAGGKHIRGTCKENDFPRKNVLNANVPSMRIKQLVEKSGMSYSELEKATGINRSSFQRYASGKVTKIPIWAIEKMAPVFGVTAAYIMGLEEPTLAAISARLLSDDAFFQTVYRLYQMTPQQLSDAAQLLEIAFKQRGQSSK